MGSCSAQVNFSMTYGLGMKDGFNTIRQKQLENDLDFL